MTWMDLESIMLSEMSQMKKDKYRIIRLICEKKTYMWNLKAQTNSQTHRY